MDEPGANTRTLLGIGSFARVYQVTSKDPCAHRRWHALNIASVADNNNNSYKHAIAMVLREASALRKGLEAAWVSARWAWEYCVGESLQSVMKKASKKKRNAAETAAAVRMYRGVSSVPSSTRTRKPSRHQACQHLVPPTRYLLEDGHKITHLFLLWLLFRVRSPAINVTKQHPTLLSHGVRRTCQPYHTCSCCSVPQVWY